MADPIIGDLLPGRGRTGTIKIKLDADHEQAAYLRSFFADVPGAVTRVLVRAINDTLRNGKTVIVKGLAEITTAPASEIRRRLTTRKATKEDLSGLLQMRRARFAAKRFKHREKRRRKGWGTAASGEGVFLHVLKQGEVRRYPHAFLADGEVRGPSIFERQRRGPGSSMGGKGRTQLKIVKAINLAEIFWADPSLCDRTIARMRDQFGKNIDSRAQYEIEKNAGKK